MKSISRIALFCAEKSPCINHILGLKRGFQAHDIDVVTGFGYLDGARLSSFLDQYRPDVVLEINRSRDQIDECDDKFFHIAWMQDTFFHNRFLPNGFGGSHLNFGVLPASVLGFDIGDAVWEVLHMGVDPDSHKPLGLREACDVTQIGYLGSGPRQFHYDMPLEMVGTSYTVDELLAAFSDEGLSHSSLDLGRLRSALLRLIRLRDPNYEIKPLFHALVNQLTGDVLRGEERRNVWREVLQVTQNVRIYGNGTWESEPDFSDFFFGPVDQTSLKCVVNNEARIVLHNGNLGPHERVLEAMCAARPVLVTKTPFDSLDGGMTGLFEDGVHYQAYGLSTLQTRLRELLSDSERRKAMGLRAREQVLAAHTWTHRAAQILNAVRKV
jgi:hypothetical protein